MAIKTQLSQTLAELGITEEEAVLLSSRMLSAVTSLQAQLGALDSQIAQLQSQREAVAGELAQANITVSKLID